MTDFRALAKDYAQREADAGGLANVEPRAIVEKMANDLGVTYDAVRDPLVTAWCLGFSG